MDVKNEINFKGFKIGYIEDKTRNMDVYCKAGDILGVLIELNLKRMKLYHNNQFIKSIENLQCFFERDYVNPIVYPTIGFHPQS